jgi:hypothetical protein
VLAGDRRYGWLTLLALLLLPATAAADYKDTYAVGLTAVGKGQWAEVRTKMQDAASQNGEPVARLRLYGQRFEPYIPQFYLGLADFRLGDCSGALAQWKNPAVQRIVAGIPDLKAEQDKGLAACDNKVAVQTPTKPEPTKPTKPEPVTPKPEPPKPEPVPVKPEPKPEPRPVQPEPRPEPPKPASARVSAPLLEAYRSYLGGRYAEVARLNADSFRDERERAQVLLVRAASHFIQAELAADPAQQESARADVRAVHALDARLMPDVVLFSPRFIAFFKATR